MKRGELAVALLAGGVALGLSALGARGMGFVLAAAGLVLGAGLAFGAAKLLCRASVAAERQPLEPVLTTLLLGQQPRLLPAVVLELIASERLRVERRDGKLSVTDGDPEADLGPCARAIEARASGRLQDGPLALTELVGQLARAHARALPAIEAAAQQEQETWRQRRPPQARRLSSLACAIAGAALLLSGNEIGALALGLSAGLWWIGDARLHVLHGHWQQQQQAWAQHVAALREGRLPPPDPRSWGELLALAVALPSPEIVASCQQRLAASADPHPQLPLLLEAGQTLLEQRAAD